MLFHLCGLVPAAQSPSTVRRRDILNISEYFISGNSGRVTIGWNHMDDSYLLLSLFFQSSKNQTCKLTTPPPFALMSTNAKRKQ